jgi:hypothetical protein
MPGEKTREIPSGTVRDASGKPAPQGKRRYRPATTVRMSSPPIDWHVLERKPKPSMLETHGLSLREW